MKITIPYKPRSVFLPFHESGKRWSVLVCHRRAGKTVASINHLIRDCLRKKDSRFAYIAPTYKAAKRIAWDFVKRYARSVPGTQFNEVELRTDFANGSRLSLYGADSPDSLRGIALDGVVFDEYSQQPPNIYTEIISPALADKKGYAAWIGTPKGKNEFWRLYDNHKNDPEWFTLMLQASTSGILPQEELDSQRKNMTGEEYEQEFECSPVASLKGAYYADDMAKARSEGRIKLIAYDKSVPVYTWWDLGVGDATVILFMQRHGDFWDVIDTYHMTGMGLDHYAKVLIEKGYVYARRFYPHDIQVRELGTGKTRLETLYGLLGGDQEVVPNLSIDDGINAVRMRFHTLRFDEKKCATLIDALDQYRKEWDEANGIFRPKPLHDWTSHWADALRYWAVTSVSDAIIEPVWDFAPPTY